MPVSRQSVGEELVVASVSGDLPVTGSPAGFVSRFLCLDCFSAYMMACAHCAFTDGDSGLFAA